MKNNNIKIALVNPRIESYSSTLPPLGLLYIAGVLEKNGFNVKVFDIYPYDDRDISALISYRPDVVGMTILTDYVSRSLYISDIIHLEIPNSLFIIGGVHVTSLPEESLLEFKARIAIICEAEYTMLELCSHIAENSNWIDTRGIGFLSDAGVYVHTQPRPFISDLDELPFPARHLLKFEDYLIPPGIIRGYWSERSTAVMTSRGCPFECIWCGSQCTFGRKVRYRSIDNVLDEFEQLIKDFQVDAIWIVDDTFTLKKERVIEFCEKIIKRKIKLTLGCQAHVKTADEEMFKMMKKAGFIQVDFGVESGSDKVLRSLKKNSDAVSIKTAFKLAKKSGLRTLATFMFGSPSEREADVEATMRLAKEINPNFASSFFITPYPGTELMTMAKENHWISNDDRRSVGLKNGPMLKVYFSEKELLKIRSRFQRMFVLRNFLSLFFFPRYIIKALLLLMHYPFGVVLGARKLLKTHVLDDFIFEFLIYYVKERANRKRK